MKLLYVTIALINDAFTNINSRHFDQIVYLSRTDPV